MAEEINESDKIHAESPEWDDLAKGPEADPDDKWGEVEDNEEAKTQHETLGEAALEAMADLDGEAEVENNKEKTTKFGAFELTDEELGTDMVLVDHVKRRSRFDVLGAKKDLRRLQEMYYCSYDEIGDYITPTIAQMIVDQFLDGSIGSTFGSYRAARLFNALPLSEQERIARSDAAPEIFRMFLSSRSEDGKPAINKMCACMTETMMERPDESGEIGRIFNGQVGDESRSLIYNLHTNVSAENRRKMFEASLKQKDASRFSLGVTFLDKDALLDCIEEVVNDDDEKEKIRVRDVAKLLKYRTDDYLFDKPETRVENDEIEPLLGGFSTYKFVRKMDNGFLHWSSEADRVLAHYGGAREEDCEKIMEQIDKADPLFIEMARNSEHSREEFTIGMLMSRKGDVLVEEALEKGDELDDVIRDHLGVYLTQYDKIDGVHAPLINSLEDIRDFVTLRLRGIRRLEQKGQTHMAKMELCRYIYRMRLGTLIRELVALGVFEYNSKDRRDTAKWGGDDPEGFYEEGGFELRLNSLRNFREKAGLSDEEYAILLDAIALAQTPEEDIGRVIGAYEQEHPGNTRRLGEIMLSIRERRRRELSKSFTETMQESLARSATEVEDAHLEYEGKPIKLLRMTGSHFRILVHHLGAYSAKDLDDPSRFDQYEQPDHDENGKPVGYISTCTLSEGALFVAQSDDLSSGDEVYYGFADLGEDGFLYEAEYDTYTYVRQSGREMADGSWGSPKEVATERQDFLYDDMDELIKRTKARKRPFVKDYNEVVLDRYARNRPEPAGELLYPTHVIVFTNDPGKISERVKKHAAYLNVPILMIDPGRYGSLL